MYYVGIDLGGTNIAAGLVDDNGNILQKDSLPTLADRGYKAIVEDMSVLCEKLTSAQGISMKQVKSIGIGSPGLCDAKNGVVIFAANLFFENVPVRDELSRYYDMPIYLENDATCAIAGEIVSGAAQGCKDAIIITLGTGVGSGIIINGKIFTGAFSGGGEIGHIVIEVGGEMCTCGQPGCFEAYASASALIRDAKLTAVRNPKTKILTLADNDINKINAKIVFDANYLGDADAEKLVDRYIDYLAIGLTNVVNIFQPEIIVVGGGISREGEKLLVPLRKRIHPFGTKKLITKIATSELGNDAGIVGSALVFKMQV